MPKVYIEKKGIWVNFPDTMGEDQIRAGIGGILSGDVAIPQGSPEPQPVAREIPSTPPPEPSFLQKVGKTLSGINLGTGEEALYDNKGSLEGFEDLTGIDLKRMAGSDIRAAQAMGADALKGLRQGAAAATQATYAAARSPFEWLLGGIEEATRPKVDRSGPMSAFTREQVEQDQAPDAGLINKVVSFPLRSLRGGEDMYAQMTELPDLAKQFISNTGSMLGALAYVGPSVGIGRQAWSMVPDKLARPFFRRLGAGLTAATVANKLDVTDEHFPETAALFMLFEGAPDTGAAAKRVGRAAYEKATRRTIEEEGAPREVFVSAEKVKDIFQTGEKISPEEGEMVRALGLKASQYKAAIDRGLHIRIPAEKIITYGDRPWVQVVKKAFGKDPYIEVRKVGEAPSFEYGPKIVKPRTVKEKPAEPPRQDIREVSPESKTAPEMPKAETGKATMPPAPEKPQGGEIVKAGEVENTVRGDIIPPVTSKQGPGEKTTEATPKPEGGINDEAYISAIKDGKYRTAQRMVDEAFGLQSPKTPLSDKQISDIVSTLDHATPRNESTRKYLRNEYAKELQKNGIEYIDAYHVTDKELESFGKNGIKGSSLDYIGRSEGTLREPSVYLFLDPDDISTGYNGITGAKNNISNIVHVRIPVSRIEDILWDSNFNVSFGTYSSVRMIGDIPSKWIKGQYKYAPPFILDENKKIVPLSRRILSRPNQSRPSEMQLDGVIETGRGTISDEGINAIQAVRDRWVNEGKGPTPEEIHQYPFLEDVFKGQKPGKSDYVPPQELAGAARAIDQARISQRTSPGTARLAQHLLTLDPTFDQNSTLEISDAVHKATPDIIKREGLDPEGEYAILGKTVSHIEDAATRTAISLYKGHDADTLVEEWYHRAYDRLNPKDRAAYDAYHKKTGDTRSPNEHFAQEGRDFFFSDKLHEAAGGIRRIFEGAREALKALIQRVRDLRGAKIPKKIQEMYRRAGQARKEARAPRKKPSKAYEEIAEGMPYYQARKINKDQADLDAGARDARRVADQQLGKKPQDIDKGFFEGITDLKPIRDLLHELGIKDKYDGITLTNKDYVDVYKYLQMPADVKISHPEFAPLYDRQRERELSKAILDHAFAKKTEPYFKGMDDADRIKVDAALIQGEQEGVSFYDPLQLKERFGLNERQIAGYTAIRDSLDAAGEMLLWEMEQSGVKPEALEEFKTRLAGYVPHKWYGNWAIIVRKKGGKKTKFMTKTNFLDRYTERDRVQALYPNDEVFVMQSKKIPYEAYQDAAPWAVSKMVDLVIDKAEVSPAMADELKQALGDLYKSKGFGAHFIKRKGTPGWTEDLAKPLAEYFAGLNGYMTKMRAIKGFAEDIQAIDPKKKPNLYRYALDYIRYVTGEPFEFAGAKQAAYIYYLYANIKSAAVNLTQNMLLGWPVLAKHTRLAGAKLLQAQARAANRHMLTDGEKAFLEEMESLGYLDPKMAVEMGAFTANPLLRQIPQGVKDFGEFIDIFQHMEAWNRRAMAVALYDSGIREPMRAAELIEEAHFRYSKGNRPELMRGIISPIMTFRSWMINYVTWLKNEIKAGRLAPVARSLAAMVLLGGFAGLPFFKLLKKLWVKVFGEDPQTAAAKHIGKSWATLIFRGLPSKLGISFTGSIGLGDILPTDLKSLGGVFADIPGRIARVIKDLSSRDYVRALEDASPEAIRQPMAAYRSATEGDTTRSGAPIFDPTTGEQQRLTAGEAATKSLGFQPMRSAERWDLQETVQQIQDARTARKQEWANRYVVAMRAGNKKEVARVVREINDYNKRMKAAGRPDDMITKAEVLSAIQSRKKAGVPPKYMRPKWKRLLEGRGMMPSQ